MSGAGFVMPVLAIGLGSVYIKPQRGFYPPGGTGATGSFVAHTVIEEIHRDDLEISEHPIEQGAAVADHSFKRPAEVVIKCAWSNSPPSSGGLTGAALGIAGVKAPAVGAVLAAGQTLSAVDGLLSGSAKVDFIKETYKNLVAMQELRLPFDVHTGKRVYRNMLFKSLSVTTDRENENSLLVTAHCRQIMVVSTQTVQAPAKAGAQKIPTKTSPLVSAGQKQLQAVTSKGPTGP